MVMLRESTAIFHRRIWQAKQLYDPLLLRGLRADYNTYLKSKIDLFYEKALQPNRVGAEHRKPNRGHKKNT